MQESHRYALLFYLLTMYMIKKLNVNDINIIALLSKEKYEKGGNKGTSVWNRIWLGITCDSFRGSSKSPTSKNEEKSWHSASSPKGKLRGGAGGGLRGGNKGVERYDSFAPRYSAGDDGTEFSDEEVLTCGQRNCSFLCKKQERYHLSDDGMCLADSLRGRKLHMSEIELREQLFCEVHAKRFLFREQYTMLKTKPQGKLVLLIISMLEHCVLYKDHGAEGDVREMVRLHNEILDYRENVYPSSLYYMVKTSLYVLLAIAPFCIVYQDSPFAELLICSMLGFLFIGVDTVCDQLNGEQTFYELDCGSRVAAMVNDHRYCMHSQFDQDWRVPFRDTINQHLPAAESKGQRQSPYVGRHFSTN